MMKLKPRSLAWALASSALVVAGGCSAFGNPPKARLRSSAELFATRLAAKADKPAYELDAPIESFAAAPLGADFLLDLRSSVTSGFSTRRVCGPLVAINPTTGTQVWKRDRNQGCNATFLSIMADEILTLEASDKDAGDVGFVRLSASTGKLVGEKRIRVFEASTPVLRDGVVYAIEDDGEQGAPKAVVVARKMPGLEKLWSRPVEPRANPFLALTAKSVLVLGPLKTFAIDRATGALAEQGEDDGYLALPGVEHPGGVVLARHYEGIKADRKRGEFVLEARGEDGKKAWAVDDAMPVVTATNAVVVTARDRKLRAHDLATGKAAWEADLPDSFSGAAHFVADAGLLVVTHRGGVLALDAATGAKKFTLEPLPKTALLRRADVLAFDAEKKTFLLDTAGGVAAFDLDGKLRWKLAVRSMVAPHREGRFQGLPGDGSSMSSAILAVTRFNQQAQFFQAQANGGGVVVTAGLAAMTQAFVTAIQQLGFAELELSMNSIAGQHWSTALAQVGLDERSPYWVRPIGWSTGRGYLVVRREDGAFKEVVVGPPDVYEEAYREASPGVLSANGKVLIVATEGLDVAKWGPPVERGVMEMWPRKLMAFPVGELAPAEAYGKGSVVEDGTF
jgi:outer membrane protein assembly factor BamB